MIERKDTRVFRRCKRSDDSKGTVQKHNVEEWTFFFSFGLEEINEEELMVGEEGARKHIYHDSPRLNKLDESKIIFSRQVLRSI